MNEYLKIAWRNIWRNKRRTIITAASIFFAVGLSVIQRGFHLGSWNNMLDNVLHSYSGYVQVHAKDYWENKTLDYLMINSQEMRDTIALQEGVKAVIPRLETFALASTGQKTKGVMITGISTVLEDSMTRLTTKLKQGQFLRADDDGVVLSSRLAKFLHLKVNDTLILIGQGYQGNSASGLFPIRGIIKLPAPEFDNQMVYMSLQRTQEFLSAEGLISSLVIDLKNDNTMNKTSALIKEQLDLQQYEVMNWRELLPELFQQFQTDNSSGIFILGILYMIVGFGILGTVLMMMNERKREFGIMMAVGMHKRKLIGILTLEMLYIAMIGVIAGMIGSLPVVLYYHYFPIELTGEYAKMMEVYGMEPIMPMYLNAGYIINQGASIFIMTLVIMIYPVYALSKMKVINALRS